MFSINKISTETVVTAICTVTLLFSTLLPWKVPEHCGCNLHDFYTDVLLNTPITRAISFMLVSGVVVSTVLCKNASRTGLNDPRVFLSASAGLHAATLLTAFLSNPETTNFVPILLVFTQVLLVLASVAQQVDDPQLRYVRSVAQVAAAAHLCIFPTASVFSLQHGCQPSEMMESRFPLQFLLLLAGTFAALVGYVAHALATSKDVLAGPVVTAFFVWAHFALLGQSTVNDAASRLALVAAGASLALTVYKLFFCFKQQTDNDRKDERLAVDDALAFVINV